MSRRPPAARTAFGPMVIAAVEQFEPEDRRILTDPLAPRLLPPGLALVARACRWRALRDRLATMTEAKGHGFPGVWGSLPRSFWGGMLCRKRYVDEQVTSAVAAGIDQVVVLGAGLSSAAYRAGKRAQAYEVDLPDNVDTKRARVRAALGAVPEHVSLVAADFETDDLAGALAAAGFRAERPVMVVWEAVTQYLTEDGVRSTFAWLATAAAGSRLIFTYVRKDFLDSTETYGAEAAHREFVRDNDLWHFGLLPGEVAPLLAEYGWTEEEQAGAAEYERRYVEPTGRRLPVSEVERFVAATKP